jgi:hypothetical protein
MTTEAASEAAFFVFCRAVEGLREFHKLAAALRRGKACETPALPSAAGRFIQR